jgi:hypothetical protein
VGAATLHPPVADEGVLDDADDSASLDGPSLPTAGGMLPSPVLPLRW